MQIKDANPSQINQFDLLIFQNILMWIISSGSKVICNNSGVLKLHIAKHQQTKDKMLAF